MTDSRSQILEQRTKDRFRILHYLEELTEGRASQHSIDIREVGQELELDENRTFAAFEYLVGEGLAEWMSLGGFGTITHQGIKEVEDAVRGNPTPHFPRDIVIITGSQNVNVAQGQSNANLSVGSQVGFVLRTQLAEYLKGTGLPVPPEGQDLIELVSADLPDRFEIAKKAEALGQQDHRIRDALKSFATSAGTSIAARPVVEAIMYGIRHI